MKRMIPLLIMITACGSGSGNTNEEIFSSLKVSPCIDSSVDHINRIGYYWDSTYDQYLDDTAHYTNLVRIDLEGNINKDIPILENAMKYDIYFYIYVDPHISKWDEFVEYLQPYLKRIRGFHIHEPYLNGLNYYELTNVVQKFKNTFGKNVGVTFWNTDVDIPYNVRYVSVSPGDVSAIEYERLLYELRLVHDEQYYFITIDSADIKMIEELWEFAKCEPKTKVFFTKGDNLETNPSIEDSMFTIAEEKRLI